MLFGKSVIWKAVIVKPVTFFFLLIITSIQKRLKGTREMYKPQTNRLNPNKKGD